MVSGVRVWLITGASSGIGRAVTQIVLDNDDIVVATHRTPADLVDLGFSYPECLLVLKCDVTKLSEITAAFARAIEKFGRVDVVFNNAAARTLISEIEGTPEDAARALEAMRVFREVNPAGGGGRLLNVSSGLGFGGEAAVGYYSARRDPHNHSTTKINQRAPIVNTGFTESLRFELDPTWNIKISIIAPGAFKTGAHNTRALSFPATRHYSRTELPSQHVRQWLKDGSGIRGDPMLSAQSSFWFSKLESPPIRWAMGRDSVAGARAKIARVSEETDEFDGWSEGLELQSAPVIDG
ncbi:hypothetical protein C8J57DRAFT_1449355 [Mycena rebaudengoi]|nr:hypothetical protein C8J57DRAFT_1449355 [Mycena rebaudengoi]